MTLSRTKGFTLIELLVVVAIISLLVSIIMVSLNTARSRASDSSKISSLLEVRSALGLYENENGTYPQSLSVLVPKQISAINPSLIYQATNVDGSACAGPNCDAYHLGIPLINTDNLVLAHDADLDNGGFNGKNDSCGAVTSTDGPSVPDLCYDVTP